MIRQLITDRGRNLRNATTLIKMYGKCGSLEQARYVFDRIPSKDLICWTAMITALAQNGQSKHALQLYNDLEAQGLKPDAFTFSSALDACSSTRDLEQGKSLHSRIRKSGLEANPVVANALINMYAKCGRLIRARKIFDRMQERNAISWNTMIAAYGQEGLPEDGLQLYHAMDLKPTSATFVTAIALCSSLGNFPEGKSMHERVQQSGFEDDPLVVSALIDMFGRCGRLDEARKIFERKRLRNTHVWSSIISAYTRRGHAKKAVDFYKEMLLQGVKADAITYVTVLNACSSLKNLEEGRGIHKLLGAKLLAENEFVGNSLVNLYGKCGCLEEAMRVFEAMEQRDIISWNSMISSYSQHGKNREAIELYHRMVDDAKLAPNEITFHSIINACSELKELQLGKEVHAKIKQDLQTDWLAASLVQMYSSCGKLEEAREIVCGRDFPNSWTALLAAHARNGESFRVLELFQEMELQGVKADGVTYASILSACSHGGLIEQGCCCFSFMGDDRGIEPLLEHYACVVDLVARSGWLHEAGDFIDQLPVEPDEEIYMALLGSCRTQNDVVLGLQIAERVLDLNPSHLGAYSLMYNLYSHIPTFL